MSDIRFLTAAAGVPTGPSLFVMDNGRMTNRELIELFSKMTNMLEIQGDVMLPHPIHSKVIME
ncbi:MAG: hypothetical protein HC804_06130 [Anaerolineae bacterium]|nr:hypothetical protein [Anaerolineae bacterium]